MPANFKVWAQLMNNNLIAIDAAISGFIVFNNLRGAWTNSTSYAVGDSVIDPTTAVVWLNQVAHVSSPIPVTFLDARTLNPTYWAVYSAPAKARGVWTGPGTSYTLNDFVVADGTKFAICIVANVSGASFTADAAAGKWSVLVDLSAAGSLVLPVLGGALDANKFVTTNATGLAYNIQTMANALTAGGATSLGISLIEAASQAAARALINAVDATGATAFGLSLLTVADLATLVASVGGMPPGSLTPFAGSSVPSGWLLCAGQAVSRSGLNTALFTAVGTAFGVGNGSTTFNLPDLRGRAIAGIDNMGGSAAGRLTASIMTPDGNTMGATGGVQLTTATTSTTIFSNGVNTLTGGANGPNDFSGTDTPGGRWTAADATLFASVTGNVNVGGTGSGTSSAFSTTQPTIQMNWIIKL